MLKRQRPSSRGRRLSPFELLRTSALTNAFCFDDGGFPRDFDKIVDSTCCVSKTHGFWDYILQCFQTSPLSCGGVMRPSKVGIYKPWVTSLVLIQKNMFYL